MRSKHGEPIGRQVVQLRFVGMSDRKGADSSFATQRIRYTEAHRLLIQMCSHRQNHTRRHVTDIQKDKNAKINAQMLGRNIYIPPLMFPWRGGHFYCTIQKGKVWKELFWLLSIPSPISSQRRSDLSDW